MNKTPRGTVIAASLLLVAGGSLACAAPVAGQAKTEVKASQVVREINIPPMSPGGGALTITISSTVSVTPTSTAEQPTTQTTDVKPDITVPLKPVP